MNTIVKPRNYPCIVLRSKTIESDCFTAGYVQHSELLSLCFMVSAFDYFVIDSCEYSYDLEDFQERIDADYKYLLNRGLKDSFAVSLPFYNELKS